VADKLGQLSRIDLLQTLARTDSASADYIAQQLGLEKSPDATITEAQSLKTDEPPAKYQEPSLKLKDLL